MPRPPLAALAQKAGKGISDIWKEELSYNLQRPYPCHKKYRYFKSVVFIIGFLVLVPLTAFNVGTIGFDMQPEYTREPNNTEAVRKWFHNSFFTWNDDKLNPNCQHVDLPVGYDFITSNLGLRYAVTGVTFHPDSKDSQPASAQRSSLTYHNNILEDCQISTIEVDMRKADDTTTCEGCWWSWMDSSADATVQCKVHNEEGLFTISMNTHYTNLATLYNEVTPNDSVLLNPYSYMIIDDAKSHASTWWGARLLKNYFVGVQFMTASKSPNTADHKPWKQFSMTFIPNQGKSIQDFNYFTLRYLILESGGNVWNPGFNKTPASLYNQDGSQPMGSGPLTEAFSFARVFSSLVLVDLGNNKTENLLLDPKLLQYILDPPDNRFREPGSPMANLSNIDWWKWQGIAPPNQPAEEKYSIPMAQSYAEFSGKTGTLGTKPATIYETYICSTPQWKSKSTVTLLVLIANFALFQTAWMLFKWFAALLVGRMDPHAMYCEGCVELRDQLFGASPPGSRTRGFAISSRDLKRTSSTRRLLDNQEDDEDKQSEPDDDDLEHGLPAKS